MPGTMAGVRWVLPLLAVVAALSAEKTATQRVIDLLNDMKNRADEERQTEIKNFEAFSLFCRDTLQKIGFEIDDATRASEDADAMITKTSDIATQAGNAIQLANANIEELTRAMNEATEIRNGEKEEFNANKQDLDETSFALQKAIEFIKNQNKDRSQAASLLQKASVRRVIPAREHQALMNYFNNKVDVHKPMPVMAQTEVEAPFGQPEVHAYESPLQPILDMLKKLQTKTTSDTNKAVMEEMNQQQNYDMFMLDSTNQRDVETSTLQRKTQIKAEAEKQNAISQAELTDAMDALGASNKNKQELSGTCKLRSEQFPQRQKLRNEEVQAIQSAIDTLEGGKVSERQARQSGRMLDTETAAAAPTVFLQMSSHAMSDPKKNEIVSMLSTAAQRLNSGALSLLTAKIASGENPFDKVLTMISDMIERLQQEAADEATAKQACDKNLKENKIARDENKSAIETTTGKRDSLLSQVAKLEQEAAETSKTISDLQQAMAEATEVRHKDKEANEFTIDDSKKALSALNEAYKTLETFYGKAAKATALNQKLIERVRKARVSIATPATWDSAYTGQQDSSKGVLGILETIQSDFQQTLTDTEAAEAQAAAQYEAFMKDSKKQEEDNKQSLSDTQLSLNQNNFDLTQTKKKLKGLLQMQESLNDAFEALNESCNNTGLSYEERKAKREEEIEALEGALQSLQNEA